MNEKAIFSDARDAGDDFSTGRFLVRAWCMGRVPSQRHKTMVMVLNAPFCRFRILCGLVCGWCCWGVFYGDIQWFSSAAFKKKQAVWAMCLAMQVNALNINVLLWLSRFGYRCRPAGIAVLWDRNGAGEGAETHDKGRACQTVGYATPVSMMRTRLMPGLSMRAGSIRYRLATGDTSSKLFLNKKTPFGADTFVKVMILPAFIVSALLCQYTGGRSDLQKGLRRPCRRPSF